MNSEIYKRIISSIILIPLTFFFVIKGSLFFNIFLSICFAIAIYEWHMMSVEKKYKLYGYFFLIFSFYSIYSIRNNFDSISLYIFLFVTIVCVSTDIGGYLFGKFFKGPKISKISPNKTYAGALGGYFLAIIFTYLLTQFSYIFTIESVNFDFLTFISILSISTISQIGDIIVSYFKRLSKIKDTGKLIPGHGGILDRIDGIIFAFPSYFIFYLLIF